MRIDDGLVSQQKHSRTPPCGQFNRLQYSKIAQVQDKTKLVPLLERVFIARLLCYNLYSAALY